MVPELRSRFNAEFSAEKYKALLQHFENNYPGALDFRIAETPLFVDHAFTKKMLEACEEIIDVILHPDFVSLTNRSIPQHLRIPDDVSRKPEFMCFDFGVCLNEEGETEPQLIELQAFPSLFYYQAELARVMKPYAGLPENYSAFLNGFDEQRHHELMKEIILSGFDPAEVILLEIFPQQQKTRLDFHCTEKALGIKTVCLSELIEDGNKLFYLRDGKQTRIRAIYNRLIFDDLQQQPGWEKMTDLTKGYDVKWMPHPNWFYRVSKFTLPFLSGNSIPDTFFLNELTQPVNLEDYVLKPLFSFAGQGVVINVTQADIDRIPDPENWILQKKVQYADIVETPTGKAKAEVRLFFFWHPEWPRPRAVHNLARLSKGEMIGTRFNKDKDWVGGTIAFFENQKL